MNIELNKEEVYQLKELIYNKIDQAGGFEELSESLKELLIKLQSLK